MCWKGSRFNISKKNWENEPWDFQISHFLSLPFSWFWSRWPACTTHGCVRKRSWPLLTLFYLLVLLITHFEWNRSPLNTHIVHWSLLDIVHYFPRIKRITFPYKFAGLLSSFRVIWWNGFRSQKFRRLFSKFKTTDQSTRVKQMKIIWNNTNLLILIQPVKVHLGHFVICTV